MALPGVLAWILDLLLVFTVSSTILSISACGFVFLFRTASQRRVFQGALSNVSIIQRLGLMALGALLLGCMMLWRVFELVNEFGTMCGWFTRIPIILELPKNVLYLCMFLFLPVSVVAIYVLSNADRPLLLVGAWIIDKYHRLAHADKLDRVVKNMYFEWAETEYKKKVLGATVVLMEQEQKNRCLVEEIARLNLEVSEERTRYKEVERTLQLEVAAERRRSGELAKKLASSKRQSGDESLCLVCMERKRQLLLRPCNHFCACNTCKPSLQNKCPICGKIVKKYEKIYIS